jgi:hypothetical protein
MVAAAIRTVFARPDQQHVREHLDVIASMLGRQLPKVETMLRDALLRLTVAVLIEAHDEWQTGDRRYSAESSMATLLTTPVASTEQVADRELIPA